MPPWIWPSTRVGLIALPTSCAATMRSTFTVPSSISTSTVAIWAAERVLWGYIVGSAVGAVTQFLLARRVARAWGGPRVERRPVSRRRLAAFGLHSSATTTLVAVRAGIVVVVLARFVGPIAVGYLSVAMLPVTLAGRRDSAHQDDDLPGAGGPLRRRGDSMCSGTVCVSTYGVALASVAIAAGTISEPR